ncbi:uncharacterized protein LOC135709497 [Ochlerotatus camptorhynchus]|uniref:uncharacterized protein LOC135709497 n=1 Tax=Ochlerotatus camptorhynchus TaxID=644619 RepID=UPI0031D3D123
MIHRKIRNILEEATVRINKLHVPYENEFRAQIQYLNLREKDVFRQFLFAHEWNLGSSKMLSVSQKAGIITASEYILRLRSRETIQQVMNDLLEVEHVLLADLVSNSLLDTESSTTLKAVLHESFSSVLDDLITDPNVVPCNYLEKLKVHLNGPELTQVRLQHMQLLLAKESTCTLGEAIGLQAQWRSECSERCSTSLGRIMNEIVVDQGSSIESLFSVAKAGSVSWKYFLSLLHLVMIAVERNKVEIVRVKGIMKDLFLQMVDSGDFQIFLILMISAREVCVSNEDVLGTYAVWYKSTIGEMSYRIKKEQFVRVVELLTRMIGLEEDPELLKVHINISVSTPPKCMELIVAYKQLCRAQLAKLQNEKNRSSASTEHAECEMSIVIDDD